MPRRGFGPGPGGPGRRPPPPPPRRHRRPPPPPPMGGFGYGRRRPYRSGCGCFTLVLGLVGAISAALLLFL